MKVKEVFRKLVRVQMPSKLTPGEYVRHAALLLFASILYGVVLHIATGPILGFFASTQPALTALGLFYALFVITWKCRALAQYIHWRLKPQVQNETAQALIYASFVSTGYLTLAELQLVNPNYQVLSLTASLCVMAATVLYAMGSFIFGLDNKNAPTPSPLSILSDIPFMEEPIGSQKQVLAALVTILKGAFKHDGEGALVVALDGAWGDGKSSIVAMALKSTEANSYVVVRFEPWRYTTQEALVTGFYSEIGKAVEAQLPGFRMARFDMVKFAQNFIVNTDKTGVVKAFVGAYARRADNYAAKINKHLGRHGKKLLVIIDDVDRLHDDSHVMRTLQLAQYLKCDIERSIILFIAEMDRIKEAIPNRLRKAYLHKIFDVTITVSRPTRSELVDFVNEKLGVVDLKAGAELSVDDSLIELLRNLRGAKRVLSMLANDVDNLGDNINIQDIFFMRVLYYAYPVVYADIRDNPSMYFSYSFSFDERDFGVYGLSEETFEADQIKHHEETIGSLGLMTPEAKRLKTLLENYFPHLKNVFKEPGIGKSYIDERKLYKGRRIGTREYLDRYFAYSKNIDKRHAVEGAIDEFFENNRDLSTDEQSAQAFSDLYEKYGNDDAKLFFTPLLSISEDRASDMSEDEKAILFREILRSYFKTAGYCVRDNAAVLVRMLGFVDRIVANEKFNLVFADIEVYMRHPTTGLRMLLYMDPARTNQLVNLRQYEGYGDLRKRILKAVDEYYIDRKNNVFTEDTSDDREWRFVLYQWAISVCNTNGEDIDVGRKERVNNYVVDLVKSDLVQLHDFITGVFWQSDASIDQYRFIFDNSPQAYDVDKFVQIVRTSLEQNERTLDTEHRKDFEKFIEQYDSFKRQEKASEAPLVTVTGDAVTWASNFGGIGAAFRVPLKIDNYEGKADFIVDARITGILENGGQWSSKIFTTMQGKAGSPIAIPENDIIEMALFISDDFTRNSQMPEIAGHEVELIVEFRSGKTRIVQYEAGKVSKV